MDNITHTLVGLAVGEAAYRICPSQRPPTSRARFWAISAIANNFPDLDFLYAGISGEKIGYLLHHRGHTHTLGLVLPQALLILLLAWLAFALRSREVGKTEWKYLWGLALLGPIIHVSLDSLNSYGVHPWWPLSSEWSYGDSLFIVEPLLWFALIPCLAFQPIRKVWKIMLWFLIPLAVGLAYNSQIVPKILIGLLLVWASLIAILTKLATSRRQTIPAFLSVSLVFLVFISMSKIARSQMHAQHASQMNDILDVILSPLPANPFCWVTLLIEKEKEGSTLTMRNGIHAIAPHFLSVHNCVDSNSMREGDVVVEGSTAWYNRSTQSVEDIRALNQNNCMAREFLKFSRAPYFSIYPEMIELKDLRFQFRSRSRGFADFSAPHRDPTMDCPRWTPSWTPPRRDLLE